MTGGLLTLHGIYNYGSILRSYATGRALDLVGRAVQIMDARQREFLELIGMQANALVTGQPVPHVSDVDLEPDCSAAHAVLEERRQHSLSFLSRALAKPA